ncbi:MAG TPA: hypothetical protein VHC49_16275 [Mycobacteriales bacterium]|nr:hypothetical protein [Mycobacteriales bacterium]
MSLLIGVIGSAPGIGKSTLCHALVEGRTEVDHFREEEIVQRPEFAALAEEFRASGTVATATILDCMREFAESCEKYDVIVADSLLPFTPSLVAWGRSEPEIETFMHRLAGILADHTVVIVYLQGDPDRALERAAEREGPGWLESYLQKMRDCGVEDIKAHRRYENDVTRRMLEAQPWQLITVDTDGRTAEDIAAEVQQQL